MRLLHVARRLHGVGDGAQLQAPGAPRGQCLKRAGSQGRRHGGAAQAIRLAALFHQPVVRRDARALEEAAHHGVDADPALLGQRFVILCLAVGRPAGQNASRSGRSAPAAASTSYTWPTRGARTSFVTSTTFPQIDKRVAEVEQYRLECPHFALCPAPLLLRSPRTLCQVTRGRENLGELPTLLCSTPSLCLPPPLRASFFARSSALRAMRLNVLATPSPSLPRAASRRRSRGSAACPGR